jgi:hypothetical protein
MLACLSLPSLREIMQLVVLLGAEQNDDRRRQDARNGTAAYASSHLSPCLSCCNVNSSTARRHALRTTISRASTSPNVGSCDPVHCLCGPKLLTIPPLISSPAINEHGYISLVSEPASSVRPPSLWQHVRAVESCCVACLHWHFLGCGAPSVKLATPLPGKADIRLQCFVAVMCVQKTHRVSLSAHSHAVSQTLKSQIRCRIFPSHFLTPTLAPCLPKPSATQTTPPSSGVLRSKTEASHRPRPFRGAYGLLVDRATRASRVRIQIIIGSSVLSHLVQACCSRTAQSLPLRQAGSTGTHLCIN